MPEMFDAMKEAFASAAAFTVMLAIVVLIAIFTVGKWVGWMIADGHYFIRAKDWFHRGSIALIINLAAVGCIIYMTFFSDAPYSPAAFGALFLLGLGYAVEKG